METQNSENINGRFALFFGSRQDRRIQCCSICRTPGHNMTTCNIASRMREFELDCSIKCQTIEILEFKDWLRETYTDENILRYYAVAKCGIQTQDYIGAIASYIYERYIYQYDSDNNSIPDLIDVDDEYNSLEDAMISVLTEMRNTPQEMRNTSQEMMQLSEEHMIAVLNNDILSERYFEGLIQNLRKDRRLIKIYNIENVLEEEEKNEKNEKKEKEETIECSICFDEYNRQECVTFGCNHEFCKDCTKKALSVKSTCAYCRAPVTKMISRTQEIHKELEEL